MLQLMMGRPTSTSTSQLDMFLILTAIIGSLIVISQKPVALVVSPARLFWFTLAPTAPVEFEPAGSGFPPKISTVVTLVLPFTMMAWDSETVATSKREIRTVLDYYLV